MLNLVVCKVTARLYKVNMSMLQDRRTSTLQDFRKSFTYETLYKAKLSKSESTPLPFTYQMLSLVYGFLQYRLYFKMLLRLFFL
jgi:hypothetical protein